MSRWCVSLALTILSSAVQAASAAGLRGATKAGPVDCYAALHLQSSDYAFCREVLNNTLWMAWTVDPSNGTIEILMARKGSGWFALAVAEEQNGGMKGADFIVVQKVDGHVVAEDRFAEDYARPVKDKEQNVVLLDAGFKNGLSFAVVRRPLLTCDKQDRQIRRNYPHKVLYAFGADGDWDLKYHGARSRGAIEVNFFAEHREKKVDDLTAEKISIQFKDYRIPIADRALPDGRKLDGTNQYKCLAVPFDNVTSLKPPFGLVGGFPIVGSPYLHHFVNAVCSDDPRPKKDIPYGNDPENDVFDCSMGGKSVSCTGIGGWAKGGSGFVLEDSSIMVPSGSKWFVFDTHFYNPTLDATAIDSSGFEYYATKTDRPLQQTTFWLGINLGMSLQPGLKRSDYAHHCPAEQVDHLFLDGSETVVVTAVLHHLHTRGRSARTYVVRDGKRMPLVIQDYYDYNFQGSIPINFTLKRGDALEVNCVYDTSGETEPVRWGERTQDEMCISILSFKAVSARKMLCMTYPLTTPVSGGSFGVVLGQRPGADYQTEFLLPFLQTMKPALSCFTPPAACSSSMWQTCKRKAVCFAEEICQQQGGCVAPRDNDRLRSTFCEPWQDHSDCSVCFTPGEGKCADCVQDEVCNDLYPPGRRSLVVNQTAVHENYYPLPRADGFYDLPWGDAYFAENGCDLPSAPSLTPTAMPTTTPSDDEDEETDPEDTDGEDGEPNVTTTAAPTRDQDEHYAQEPGTHQICHPKNQKRVRSREACERQAKKGNYTYYTYGEWQKKHGRTMRKCILTNECRYAQRKKRAWVIYKRVSPSSCLPCATLNNMTCDTFLAEAASSLPTGFSCHDVETQIGCDCSGCCKQPVVR